MTYYHICWVSKAHKPGACVPVVSWRLQTRNKRGIPLIPGVRARDVQVRGHCDQMESVRGETLDSRRVSKTPLTTAVSTKLFTLVLKCIGYPSPPGSHDSRRRAKVVLTPYPRPSVSRDRLKNSASSSIIQWRLTGQSSHQKLLPHKARSRLEINGWIRRVTKRIARFVFPFWLLPSLRHPNHVYLCLCMGWGKKPISLVHERADAPLQPATRLCPVREKVRSEVSHSGAGSCVPIGWHTSIHTSTSSRTDSIVILDLQPPPIYTSQLPVPSEDKCCLSDSPRSPFVGGQVPGGHTPPSAAVTTQAGFFCLFANRKANRRVTTGYERRSAPSQSTVPFKPSTLLHMVSSQPVIAAAAVAGRRTGLYFLFAGWCLCCRDCHPRILINSWLLAHDCTPSQPQSQANRQCPVN